MQKRFYLFSVFLLITTWLYGQDFDTTLTEAEWQKYQTVDRITWLQFDLVEEDSGVQRPDVIIPTYSNRIGWFDQGYYLSPMYSPVYSIRKGTNFELVPNPFAHAYLISDSIRHYTGSVPRSFLKYSQGAGNLLHLTAEHDQQIARNWSVGMNYRRNKIQNLFYDNLPQFDEERMTNGYGLQLYSRFATRNLKYEVMADYSLNKYIIQETGGVTDPGKFDTLSGRQRLYSSSAYLADAENLFKDRVFSVTQFYRDGRRRIAEGDSVIQDTTYNNIGGQWMHVFRYRAVSNRFVDNGYNEAIYPSRYLSVSTYDSSHLSSVSNSISRIQRIGATYVLRVGGEHELGSFKQKEGYEGTYSNLRAFGSLKGSKLDLKLNLALLGFYKGDFEIEGGYQALDLVNENVKINLNVEMVKRRPSFNEQFLLSNYLSWNQSLSSIAQNCFSVQINTANALSISAGYQTVSNFVYVDSMGVPQQISDNIAFPQFKAEVPELQFGSIHLNAKGVFQQIPDGRIHLPSITIYGNVYLQGYMFKKNMLAQLGVDAYYVSSFKGIWYDPSSRLFRNSETTTGGYPMLNAYLNMHVKTMQLFVVGEHLLQGTSNNDWQSLPGYPMRARSVRFGAAWRLFD